MNEQFYNLLPIVLPIAAILLILVATMSSRIEKWFESQDEEEYDGKNYQDDTKNV